MWNLVSPILGEGLRGRGVGVMVYFSYVGVYWLVMLYLLGPSRSSSYMTSSQPTGSAKHNYKQAGGCSVACVARRRSASVLRYVMQMFGMWRPDQWLEICNAICIGIKTKLRGF